MRLMLITGLAAILPVLAQSPDDVISGVRIYERSSASPRLNFQLSTRAVKNAPYSADAISKTTQFLADGNRIEQSTTQKLYRDSDGRERREESVLAVGALAQPEAPRVITITDPVENVTYTLHPETRTARKNKGASIQVDWLTPQDLNITLRYRATVGDWLRGLDRAGAPAQGSGDAVKEDLGMRNVEGVMAQGSRTTETIPAGQIGNLLPINVVDEVWYSPELRMNVLTIHTDPRTGETLYKLMNISRANPPRALFEPPADYTIVDSPGGAGITYRPAGDVPAGGRGRGGAAGNPQK